MNSLSHQVLCLDQNVYRVEVSSKRKFSHLLGIAALWSSMRLKEWGGTGRLSSVGSVLTKCCKKETVIFSPLRATRIFLLCLQKLRASLYRNSTAENYGRVLLAVEEFWFQNFPKVCRTPNCNHFYSFFKKKADENVSQQNYMIHLWNLKQIYLRKFI